MIWFAAWFIASLWLIHYSAKKHAQANGLRRRMEEGVEELQRLIDERTPSKNRPRLRIVKNEKESA